MTEDPEPYIPTPRKAGRPKGSKDAKPRYIEAPNRVQEMKMAKETQTFLRNGRQQLAMRLRSIRLFGETKNVPEPEDHPMIQCLYEMRDVYENFRNVFDPKTQLGAVEMMFKFCKALVVEGNKAHSELNDMMMRMSEFRERQKQHAERMEIAREKAGRSDIVTAAELVESASESAEVALFSTAEMLSPDKVKSAVASVIGDKASGELMSEEPKKRKRDAFAPLDIDDIDGEEE